MLRTLGLWLVLFGLWISLSGFLEGFLLSLGLASSLFVALVAARMDGIDRGAFPFAVHAERCFAYCGWLIVEIVKASVDVTRRVLSPSLPITPCVRRLPASQQTDLGRVIYANSITLTPGTITIDLGGGEVEVHALTRAAMDELAQGEMDRRVTRLEDRA